MTGYDTAIKWCVPLIQSMPIFVLLTGGSSWVPVVEDLASGTIELDGASFEFRKVKDLPDWIENLPREDLDLIAEPYRQCAVAIGGTQVNLPEQIRDLQMVFTPAPPGKRTLERYQTQGI